MGLSNFLIKGRAFESTIIATTLKQNPCSEQEEVSTQMMGVWVRYRMAHLSGFNWVPVSHFSV